MRYLLVVDDEPNLVDGLCHFLSESLGDDIDVSKAYSGGEALAILSENPIDLVITDVRMPDISGLDLLQAIHERQMNSRVLILTGYDEFNTIHEAVKLPPTIGFLLKNEGDDEIIKMVKNTLATIEEEENVQMSLALAERQSKTLDVLLRERRLWHVLGIFPSYDELEIPGQVPIQTLLDVDLEKPLLLVMVRTSSEYLDASTLIWLEQQISKMLGVHFAMEMSILSPTNAAWLLQTKPGAVERADNERAKIIKAGMLEVQSLLASKGVEISAALSSKRITADDLPGYVRALKTILEGLFVDGHRQQIIDVSTDAQGTFADSLERANSYVSGNKHIHRAKNALNDGDESEWESALAVLSKLDPSIITRLLPTLISTAETMGMPSMSLDHDYTQLKEIGIKICRHRKQNSKHAISGLISRVDEVIEKNLGNPVFSLSALAALVHHNPSYLSRLYKQQTGVSVVEKINEERIGRACELLNDPSLKISDISLRVGYASPSYFTFIFRKKMGVTPKEYRSGK